MFYCLIFVLKYLQYEVTHNTAWEWNSCQWMRSANNVMCPSLRELISSSGSCWVLKGLRVHSKFIVGLPAPMGQSTNGWPWGLAVPDLRRSCLTTSLPPRWPRPSLPLASTFNSLIFDQIIKQTPAFRCMVRVGGGLTLHPLIWCRCAVRQCLSLYRWTHLLVLPAAWRSTHSGRILLLTLS